MLTFALVCIGVGKAGYGSSFTADDAMKVWPLQVLATFFCCVALGTSLNEYLLPFLHITSWYAHRLDMIDLRCTESSLISSCMKIELTYPFQTDIRHTMGHFIFRYNQSLIL